MKLKGIWAISILLFSIIVVMSASNLVQASGPITATIKVGNEPESLAYDSAKGEIFVANAFSSSVSVISDNTNTVVATISLPTSPSGIVYDSGKGEIFAANYQNPGYVYVISDSNNSVVATIPVGPNPMGIAYDSGKGEIFVVSFTTETIYVISDSTNTVVATIPVGHNPSGLTYDPNTGEIFVYNLIIDYSSVHTPNTVSVISDSNNSIIANVYVGYGDGGLIYDSGKGEIFAASSQSNLVSVISEKDNSVVATVSPVINPFYLGYGSGKGEIFVTNTNSNSVSVISDNDNSLISIVPIQSPSGFAYDSAKGEMFISNWNAGTVSVISDSATLPPPTTPTPSPSSTPVPNPTSLGSWTAKPPMPATNPNCKAAVVNGIIYVFGAITNYAYNPATDKWTTIPPLPTPRANFAAAAYDNKIYVIGGQENGAKSGCSVNEVYDPSTNTWTGESAMPTARFMMNAATVNGKIYVMGGETTNIITVVNVTEIYDPKSNSWSTGADLLYPSAGYASAVINNNIYLIGGEDTLFLPQNLMLNFTQIYNTATDTWSLGAPIPAAAFQSGAEASSGILAPARVYVFGGVVINSSSASNQNFVYDPNTDSWSSAAPLPNGLSGPAVGVVKDLFYLIGGGNAMTTFVSNWQYTPIGYSIAVNPTSTPILTPFPTPIPTPNPTLTPAPTSPSFNATVKISTLTVLVHNNSATCDESSVTGVKVTVAGSSLIDGMPINVTSIDYESSQPAGTGMIQVNGAFFYDVRVTSNNGVLDSDVTAVISITNPSFNSKSVLEYWNGGAWVSVDTTYTAANTVVAAMPASALTGTPIAVCTLTLDKTSNSSSFNIIYGLVIGLAAVIAVTAILFVLINEKTKNIKP